MYSFRSPLLQGLLILTALGLGCSDGGKQQPSKTRDVGPVVRVTTPTQRNVTDYEYFTGRIEAPESVKVQSRVTGYLDSVDFVEGAEVKAGQRLFLIDPRPYKAALDVALSQVRLAEASLKLAVANYARAVAIAKTPGAISQQDVDKYAAAKDEAAAEVAAAKANAEAARLNVEFTNIASPIDGAVGRYLVTKGNLVKQDMTLLTTVVSQDPMYAYFDIDQRSLLRIERLMQKGNINRKEQREGFPVQMGLADEGERYPHEGIIDYVSNQMNPSTGTRQVRGKFPNPLLGYKNNRLLAPGMFVRVRLPFGGSRPAMLVPQEAIGSDQGKKYLKVVGPENVVEYRPVTLGAQQPDGLQVVIPVQMVRTKDGLRPAVENEAPGVKTVDSIGLIDRIIVGGLQQVHVGMHVTPRQIEPKADGSPGDHLP